MAYLLRYNSTQGSTAFVTPATTWTGAASGDWSVTVCFSCSSFSATPRILGISGSTGTRVVLINTNGSLSWATVGITSAANLLQLNTRYWVKAESVGETKNLYYSTDGVNFTLLGSASYSASSFSFNRIGSSASLYSPVFDFYSFEFVGGTYSDKWDSTTAPSTGTTWPSVGGTRNITLTNFTGAADSWWVFYDAGGGGSFTGTIGKTSLSLLTKQLSDRLGYVVDVTKSTTSISHKQFTVSVGTILGVGKQTLEVTNKQEFAQLGYVNVLSKKAYTLLTKPLNIVAGTNAPFIGALNKTSYALAGKQLTVNAGWNVGFVKLPLTTNGKQENILAGLNIDVNELNLALAGKPFSIQTGTSIAFVGELNNTDLNLSNKSLSVITGTSVPFFGSMGKNSLALSGKALSRLHGQILDIQKQSVSLIIKQLSIGEIVYPIIPVERLFTFTDKGRTYLLKQTTNIYLMKGK